jgi:hypothetical protein
MVRSFLSHFENAISAVFLVAPLVVGSAMFVATSI